MDWIEKITEWLLNIRDYLTRHPKKVWGFFAGLIAFSALGFGGLYFYQEKQRESAEDFYQFVFFELPQAEETEKWQKIQTQIAKAQPLFLDTYLKLQALDQALADNDKEKIERLVDSVEVEKIDNTMQDLVRLKLADADIQIDRIDNALTRLNQITSIPLEVMQSLLLAKAYQKKGDIQNAKSALSALAQQSNNTAMKNLAQKLLLLL